MIEIEASSFGPELLNLLDSPGGGVLAVLSSSIYLESFGGYVLAVVGEDGVDGPLTLRVRDLGLCMDAVRGKEGLPFRASRGRIDIGGLLAVSLCEARAWEPAAPDHLGSEAARKEASRVLIEAMAASAPDRSSAIIKMLVQGGVVRGGHSDGVRPESVEPQPGTSSMLGSRRLAAGVAKFVQAWHASDADGAGGAVVSLLGLGEGLTPSGDDIASGILATLAWRARLGALPLSVVETLVKRVRDASSRTNRISARLLHYASRGIVYAPAMQLGAALLAGNSEAVEAPAQRLFTIGHTTGIDLATGLLVGSS
jgi:hypothetical protein